MTPRRLLWEAAWRWKRFKVCLLCLWYLRHWPMYDLSDAEWMFQLDGETAWDSFVEGWCRD
jgi:hypothetical protein